MNPRYLVPWRIYVALGSIFGLMYLACSKYMTLRCLYVVLLMIIFWVTEVVPLAITACLPVPLYPVLGIMSSKAICFEYLNGINMMLLGGLIAAVAIEHSGLHYRIVLPILLLIGTTPMRVMCILIVPATIFSMFIPNTLVTVLMVPIVRAVVSELKEGRQTVAQEELPPTTTPAAKEPEPESPPPDKETIGYFIATVYAANIGGIGTLVGSPTNLVLKNLYEETFNDDKNTLGGPWVAFGIPYVLVAISCTFIYLQFFYMGLFRKKTPEQVKIYEDRNAVRGALKERYKALEGFTWQQSVVSVLFIFLILVWLFRSPTLFAGWSTLFYVEITEATPTLFIVVLFFIIPAKLTFFRCSEPYEKELPSVLTWSVVHKTTSWNVILLMGGSLAMARGMTESGLSDEIGKLFIQMQNMPGPVVLMFTCLFTVFLTTFSTNTAISHIVLPALATMSKDMNIHPLYLMIPATISCSLAFTLPVSTPSNAIVHTAGGLRTLDLIIAGVPVTIICLVLLYVMFLALGGAIYNFNKLPF